MKFIPKFSVENPVLVGVLMITILVGGAYSGSTLVREMFPESRPNQVMITTVYPGATPVEVEKGLAIRLEEAIRDVENIEKVETTISEGLSLILVEMDNNVDDLDQVVNEFKAAIDSIPRDDLPADAEETIVSKFEPKLPVISVALYGDVNEKMLKELGLQLQDDLLLLPGISNVIMSGTRKAEITVEVEPEDLYAYQLSLAEVTRAISESNLDLPGGQVKTPAQNVAVRTLGETDEAERIADTVIRTAMQGETVRIRDVGRVIDGFEDSDIRGRFQGKPAVDVTVYKTPDQDAIEIAQMVKAFAAGKSGQDFKWDLATRIKSSFAGETEAQKVYRQAKRNPYPPGVSIELHSDLSRFIQGRLDLLKRNGTWGLAFVFISLLLFLNWRVAFWVMMGLLLTVAGAMVLMQMVGATLNLISMFGLIVVLGLIVDDAIVVGENIYARVERGESPREAAIIGTQEVIWPVLIAVATTIGAFAPLRFIEGQIGDFMGILPVVVTCALLISLVESFSILPSHLADWLKPVRRDRGKETKKPGLIRRLREKQKYLLDTVAGGYYERFLRLAVSYRYVAVTVSVGLLIITLGFIRGGHVPFVFIQEMDSETIIVNAEMPVGVPAEKTEEVIRAIERKANTLPEVKTIYALVGATLDLEAGDTMGNERSHLGQCIIELAPLEEREGEGRSSEEVIDELRATTNQIPGVNLIKYITMQGGPGGPEIEIEITGPHISELVAASDTLKEKLSSFDGVYDIGDDFEEGRREVQLTLLDSARPLGLTTRALATEVRGAFYGLEARTIQRNREDVDIRVRFPADRRKELHELESMSIVTAAGLRVPLREVAKVEDAEGYSAIRRVDQRRAVTVSADVNQSVNNADAIITAMAEDLAAIEDNYPGILIEFGGSKRETEKSFGSLQRDFLIALALIFVMLAGLFKSYVQPLVVLTAVPFGLVGAVAGHYAMGYPLTILSLIGVVALTGIVVNDALILVDFVNKEIATGQPIREAVVHGGRRRFRPILLTSMTTILGLLPMLAETSFQARFLIPMAISISFGLAFATVLTLVLVPSIYLIFDDLQRFVNRIWYGTARPHESDVEPVTTA